MADTTEHYLGPIDQSIIDGINTNLERQHIREKPLWNATTELEAEVRICRDCE